MMKRSLIRYLPLTLLVGLALYFSNQAQAEIAARTTPHAPDWVGSPVPISDTASPNVSDRPFIKASPDGNKLIIVYNRRMSAELTDKDPYFSRSTNGGQSWSNPAPIHTSLGTGDNTSSQVNLEIDGNGTGHAVWVEGDNTLMYSKEPNWGNSNPTVIDAAEIVANPQIIASGNNTLDIIWAARPLNDNTQIFHTRSTDSGTSWSSSTQISSGLEGIIPHAAIDQLGRLNVVWEDTDLQNGQVFTFITYVRGTPSGSTINWSASKHVGDLSDDPLGREPRRPKILAVGNTLHVAFTAFENRESQWVHYVTCFSACLNLQNWSGDNNISGTFLGVNANSPRFIVSDIFTSRGCNYIYFHGIDDLTVEDNEQILGTNNCDGWAASARDVVTQPQNQSLHTSIAPTDTWIHITYEQTGDQSNNTTRQVYYRRGTPPPFSLLLPFTAKQ